MIKHNYISQEHVNTKGYDEKFVFKKALSPLVKFRSALPKGH